MFLNLCPVGSSYTKCVNFNHVKWFEHNKESKEDEHGTTLIHFNDGTSLEVHNCYGYLVEQLEMPIKRERRALKVKKRKK